MSARVYTDAPPGGDWTNRKRSYGRILRLLFKKQFLSKLRRKSAIVEILIALVMVVLTYPIWYVSRKQIKAVPTPSISPESSVADQSLMGFCGYGNRAGTAPFFYAIPDTPKMHSLIEDSGLLQKVNGILTMTGVKEMATIKYMNSVSELKKTLRGIENNGIGIYWSNIDSNDADTNPEFQIYTQAFSSISDEIAKFLQTGLIKEKMDSISESASPSAEEQLLLQKMTEVMNANVQLQQFASPKLINEYDISIFCSMVAIIPIILASMPDIQSILEEKDSKVAALGFFMGCPESAYWLVNFISPFIFSIFPYLLMGILYCYAFAMTHTSFGIFFILSILFIIAHLLFQFWLLTFMKTAKSGRMLTVTFLVLMMFFGFLHSLFTLDENNGAPAVRHVFSIIPMSAYQMWIMNAYMTESLSLEPYTWSNFSSDGVYPSWVCFMWLILDIVIYGILFLVFNLAMPRQFGAPRIKWSELFKKSAWKRVFSKQDQNFDDQNVKQFFSVKGLSKIYTDGGKPVTALDNIDFHVNKNEVIVMIGPNGAGKSTLLNCIAGATEPNQGSVSILENQEETRLIELQKYLGVVFQDNVIYSYLSIKEHLYLFGAFRGISEHEIADAIEYYADQLQLEHMLDNRAGDLSGGQKRKLCIAISLLGNPPLVLMDEPTAGVDVQARQLIWKMISSLKNTTSIITSHALEEAEAVSSRLFIAAAGKLVFCGTSTELRSKHKCGYLLRLDLDNNADMDRILTKIKKYVPDAYVTEERADTIAFPVADNVPELIEELTENQKDLGIHSFSCAVEQLEDMLLKLIQSEEAKCAN